MLDGEAGRAERAVLLLRMLQDDQFDAVVDFLDAVTDAQRKRLEAARAGGIG